jgi:hypothetical protein
MTVVGKILVILNLVFSVAVGAFAVMDFTARTHWQSKYDQLSKKYAVVEASGKTYQKEADDLNKEKKELNTVLSTVAGKELEIKGPEDADRAGRLAAKVLKDRGKAIGDLKTQVANLQTQLAEARKSLSKSDTTTTASLEEVKRRQADTEKMQTILKEQTDRNIELVKEKNELRDRAVAAEIQAKSYRDMNNRLEEQLQDMARDVARLRATGAPGGGGGRTARATNPPPENVEGLVRRAEGSLVTITIGSDAGLSRGNTMEVFRLGQQPKYLGRIKIVEVTPTQAVGQVTGRMLGAIQAGDHVASSIMGGR